MTNVDRLWRLPAILLLALVSMSPWRLEPRNQAPVPTVATRPTELILPQVPAQVAPPLQTMPQQTPSPGPGQQVAQPPPLQPQSPLPTAPTPPPAQPAPTLPLRPDDFPRGRYHLVQPGETAADVATIYRVSSKWTVYDANPFIVRPNQLPVGAWLYIPHPSLTPARRPRPGEAGWSETPSPNVIVDQVWLDLARCESSGNWGIDSGNGYYGGLQFLPSSWRAVGGRGMPHHAHPMEQIARADALQRIQGWKAWPVCSVKLGLRPPDKPAPAASGSPGPAPSGSPAPQQ